MSDVVSLLRQPLILLLFKPCCCFQRIDLSRSSLALWRSFTEALNGCFSATSGGE